MWRAVAPFITIQEMVGDNIRAKAVLIFDGDDTLWRTMPLYTAAKRRFFRLMERVGFPRPLVEPRFERLDRQNVDKWGFTVERFRTSMIETYREFAKQRRVAPDERIEGRIAVIAFSVTRGRARTVASAREVLQALRPAFRLVLLTKGERNVQERRIADSSLQEFFDAVRIVARKDEDAFRAVIDDLGVSADRVWSIGDSLRSDIHPAIHAGARAVWIPRPTWSYEHDAPIPGVRRVRSLRELPKVLINKEVPGDLFL
jgi:putative hydrolase of the HAD superfamily